MTAPGVPQALPVERTRLAWRRTTLAAAVATLIAGAHLVTAAVTGPAVASLAVIGLALVALLAVAHRRIATLAGEGHPAIRRSPVVVALLIFTIALAGVALTLS
jgi:hypothetical protein